MPEVDTDSLQALAERLRNSIAALAIEPAPRISASVGITLVQNGDSVADLLQRVDQALYRSKELGGNVVAW